MVVEASTIRRPSKRELRERLHHSGKDDVPEGNRCVSFNAIDDAFDAMHDTAVDLGLPPAFLNRVAGKKIRPLKTQLEESPEKKDKSKSQKSRKELVESMGKHDLKASFRDRERERKTPASGSNESLSRNPYADDADWLFTSTTSLDTEPPPERQERQQTAFNKSVLFMDKSLDLSGFGIPRALKKTSMSCVSDEQWARFKLLGRLGLGDIKVTQEQQSLIDRNYNIMLRAMKKTVALRDGLEGTDESLDNKSFDFRTGNLLDEVRETVKISKEAAKFKRDPDTINVGTKVEEQLRDYVAVICCMYRDNAFHNFEHASHVVQAVNKLVSLVTTPDDVDYTDLRYGCGVASEPWCHFALILSALIHDVDHVGVPNAQLIKEGAHVAGAYKNKSVAEQNSIELAWNLLMEPCYKELRGAIFLYRSELSRFRSLVVTSVMATDIADKELAAMRKGRVAEVLNAEDDENAEDDIASRKATFVQETLIQAADVSHTMSPFAVYKKWNHKLYKEMYNAFKSGRAETDPTESWYKDEFGFFDFYVIPLSKKLNDCGIFGQASADYLHNAMQNRKEWEEKGEEIVASYVAEMKAAEDAKPIMPLADKARRSSMNCSPAEEIPLGSDYGEFKGEEYSDQFDLAKSALSRHNSSDTKSISPKRHKVKALEQNLKTRKKEKQVPSDGKLKSKKEAKSPNNGTRRPGTKAGKASSKTKAAPTKKLKKGDAEGKTKADE
jgi:hypothetical protein